VTLRVPASPLLALAGLALLGLLAGYGALQRWLDAPLAIGEARSKSRFRAGSRSP